MTIRWSAIAIEDLKSIRAYIASDNPSAATRIALRIRDAVNNLERFPQMGRVGRVSGTRELVIPGTNYIAAYALGLDEVQILAVLHGKQRWPEAF
jgi:toxin ParE1/3/4